jgi:UDP-N-acetylglucosamine acyltransferase
LPVGIHPLACVSPDAQLGRNVSIGPFCVVEADVVIGDNCDLASHVTVRAGTVLGPGNRVFEGAVLGGPPQHVHMPERPGRILIGAGNVLREHVTVHRAMSAERQTRIGDGNLVMAGVHIAHDCQVGSQVIIANNTTLGGHVVIEDQAFVSGMVGVHQFCRIGRLAMVGGQAHLVKDVPPFVTVDGASSKVVGLNLVGLRRAGLAPADIAQLKAAYRLIYRGGLPWTTVLEYLAVQFPTGPAAHFLEFFQGGSRGFIPVRAMPAGATLLLHHEQEDSSELPRSKVG